MVVRHIKDFPNLHDILRTEKMVPDPTSNLYKKKDEMGRHGSPWVHIDGGGSRRHYRGLDIPNMTFGLGCGLGRNTLKTSKPIDLSESKPGYQKS